MRQAVLFILLTLSSLSAEALAHRWPDSPLGKKKPLELPATSSSDSLLLYTGFTVCYDSQTLTPCWVAYELTAEETEGPWSRKGLNFVPDPDYHGRQAENIDYRKSGYSRGHMAPAADMKWDSLAMLESFYFTNCIPQDIPLNNGKWNQLEEKTRRWAKQYGRVYVVCGPVYQNEDTLRIGPHGVAVPDACFKALLIPKESGYSAVAFLMSNGGEERPLKECALTVDELERIILLDLFCNLPRWTQRRVEREVCWQDWGLYQQFDK